MLPSTESNAAVLELMLVLLGACGTLIMGMGAWILNGMAKDIKDLAHNSTLLNERMGVTVERVDVHEQSLARVDERLTRLETKEI